MRHLCVRTFDGIIPEIKLGLNENVADQNSLVKKCICEQIFAKRFKNSIVQIINSKLNVLFFILIFNL